MSAKKKKTSKKAPTRKSAKKSPGKKAAKKKTTKKAAAKKTPAKKAASKKEVSPAKKVAAKKKTTKKAAAKKALAKKALAKKAPAKKAASKKEVSPAKKVAAKKTPARAIGRTKAAGQAKPVPRSKPIPLSVIPHPKYGYKFECFSCQTKFYLMGKIDPVCPKCGCDQRERPREAPKEVVRPKRRAVRPMAPLLDDDDEVASKEEDLESRAGRGQQAPDAMFDDAETASVAEDSETEPKAAGARADDD